MQNLVDEALQLAKFLPSPDFYEAFYRRRVEPTLVSCGIWTKDQLWSEGADHAK